MRSATTTLRDSLIARAEREIAGARQAVGEGALALVDGRHADAHTAILRAVATAHTAHEAAAAVDHREVIRAYKAIMVVTSALGDALEQLGVTHA
jgi:hypothetical protein